MPKTLAAHLASRVDPFARPTELAPEKAAELEALAKKFNDEAAEYWEEPSFHRQVAADITSELTFGFQNQNPFSQVIDTQTVAENAKVTFREVRGLKAYMTARGGEIEESQIRDEILTMSQDSLGFHVSEFEDDIRLNFSRPVADTLRLGQERLAAEQKRRIVNAMIAAVDNSSPYYSSGAGISKSVLDGLLDDVDDEVRPDGVLNVPITILGRRKVVSQVMDFAGYSPTQIDEIMRTGRLAVYRGCQIVQLPNLTDEDGDEYFPNSYGMFILQGTAGAWRNWGGFRSKTWIENTVDYWHYRTIGAVGGMIHKPQYVRRYVDTTL